jgi:hypothetical protein
MDTGSHLGMAAAQRLLLRRKPRDLFDAIGADMTVRVI